MDGLPAGSSPTTGTRPASTSCLCDGGRSTRPARCPPTRPGPSSWQNEGRGNPVVASKRVREERRRLRERALAGDANACYDLGADLASRSRLREAAEWARRAARQGHAEAQYEL